MTRHRKRSADGAEMDAKLTPARRRVLAILADGPVPETACHVYGYRKATLDAVCWAGLARFRPYAREPHYEITPSGRAALGDQSA